MDPPQHNKEMDNPPFCGLLEGSGGCFGVAGSRSFDLLKLINLTLRPVTRRMFLRLTAKKTHIEKENRQPCSILFPHNSAGANAEMVCVLLCI